MGNWLFYPATLSEKPWRKTKGWDDSAKKQLKAEVMALGSPQTSLSIPSYNILLAGQISSGKSSFINSIYSVLKGGVHDAKASVGRRATSLTSEYCQYPMSPHLKLNVYDTIGIEPDNPTDLYIDSILQAVDGHVPDRYKFALGEKFQQSTPEYITNPRLANKVHCVAIVVDAQTVNVMQINFINKLQRLANGLIDKKIPIFVLLTHMDEFGCPVVQQDVTKMYRSVAVEALVEKISKMVNGLPKSQIFPIINYCKDSEVDAAIDVLVLNALRQMLRACCGHIENLEKQYRDKSSWVEREEASYTPFRHQNEVDHQQCQRYHRCQQCQQWTSCNEQ